MVGVKSGTKLQGSHESWWNHHCPLVCLACPSLLCPPLPSLIQTSGSPKEFLEAAVSGVVESGGGWVAAVRSQGGQEVGDGVGWPFLGCGPEKWQNERRTPGAALLPGWPGSGAMRGPHEWLGCSKSLGLSRRGLRQQGRAIPVPGWGLPPPLAWLLPPVPPVKRC